MKFAHTTLFQDIKKRSPNISGQRITIELNKVRKTNPAIFYASEKLWQAFVWEISPQGHAFWYRIYLGEGIPK